jgi:hypothetical protein
MQPRIYIYVCRAQPHSLSAYRLSRNHRRSEELSWLTSGCTFTISTGGQTLSTSSRLDSVSERTRLQPRPSLPRPSLLSYPCAHAPFSSHVTCLISHITMSEAPYVVCRAAVPVYACVCLCLVCVCVYVRVRVYSLSLLTASCLHAPARALYSTILC